MTQFSLAQLVSGVPSEPLPAALALHPEAASGGQAALFSSLLGQQVLQISPEVLQQALVPQGGQVLPGPGNDLPEPTEWTVVPPVAWDIAPAAVAAAPSPTVPASAAAIVVQGGVADSVHETATGLDARRPLISASPMLVETKLLPADDPEDPLQPSVGTVSPLGSSAPYSTSTIRSASVDVPVSRPGWDQSLGQRVVWMAEGGHETAELRLNPPHLGPLKVRVELNGDQANVSFSSNHVLVRDAVESAVPRLREMLEASGLSLANVDVSEHGSPNRHREGAERAYASPDTPEESQQGVVGGEGSQPEAGVGLVDYYV